MRDRAEGLELEEPRRALDRVDGAEDVRQHVPVPGILFEDDQIAVELIEVLVTLDQELAQHFVHFAHAARPVSGLRGPPQL